MTASIRHLVLYTVEQVSARPNGRTYIQKLCFFVSKILDRQLGFRAHYYGPYSDQISAELAFLTGAGLVTEARRGSGMPGTEGWEIARFDYSLTEAGNVAVGQLAQRQPADAQVVREAIKRVLDAGDQNYIQLSFAAKTSWILEHEGGPMTFEGISKAADRFQWNVAGTDVQNAATFLEKMGLIKLNQSTNAST